MAKKTIYPGTQGRKNKVLRKPIDLTGINYQSWANIRWAKVRLALIGHLRALRFPKFVPHAATQQLPVDSEILHEYKKRNIIIEGRNKGSKCFADNLYIFIPSFYNIFHKYFL